VQTHIDDLVRSSAVRLLRLCSFCAHHFEGLEITCCNNATVRLCSESDYCGIPLHSWHLRTSYCTQDFSYRGDVSFHLPTYVGPRSSPQVPLGQNSDVEAAARYLHAQIDKDVSQEDIGNPDLLPWLAQAFGLPTDLPTYAYHLENLIMSSEGTSFVGAIYHEATNIAIATRNRVAGAASQVLCDPCITVSSKIW